MSYPRQPVDWTIRVGDLLYPLTFHPTTSVRDGNRVWRAYFPVISGDYCLTAGELPAGIVAEVVHMPEAEFPAPLNPAKPEGWTVTRDGATRELEWDLVEETAEWATNVPVAAGAALTFRFESPDSRFPS
jgi:hypothetical protein